MALGDKLGSVLLYHVAPGALTPEELAAQTSLPTALGQRMGAAFDLTVGSAGGKVGVWVGGARGLGG